MAETITVVNPVGISTEQAPEELGRLPNMTGASIALIDSARPNSAVFMGILERVLKEAGVGSVKMYRSLAVGLPLPDDMLTKIAEEADAAIYGVTD